MVDEGPAARIHGVPHFYRGAMKAMLKINQCSTRAIKKRNAEGAINPAISRLPPISARVRGPMLKIRIPGSIQNTRASFNATQGEPTAKDGGASTERPSGRAGSEESPSCPGTTGHGRNHEGGLVERKKRIRASLLKVT